MKTYRVASQEGAEFYAGSAGLEPADVKVGSEAVLELTAEQELALVAAGWLEHTKKKEG